MDDSLVTNSECQLKTVTCEEYNYLKKLPAQVKKLKRSVNKLQIIIRNKDMEIEKMRKENKRNQNFSKMSTVSIHNTHTFTHFSISCMFLITFNTNTTIGTTRCADMHYQWKPQESAIFRKY